MRNSGFSVIFVVLLVVVRSLNAEDRKNTDDTREKDHHNPDNEHEFKDEDDIEIRERIDDIKKSTRDERHYRGLTLSNGLRVVLISDPQTDVSATALTVNVGNMHDPEEIPGLAHLLEHMLFMGSEKYPGENYYDAFVEEHAGSKNGETCEDRQTYFFKISSANLAEATDISAQMFLGPRLTPSAMEREVNAVDSENQMNSIEEGFIVERLERSLSIQGHAHAKFRCGNKTTLETNPQLEGIDVCAKLFDLFRDRFSSNMMYLAVLGKGKTSKHYVCTYCGFLGKLTHRGRRRSSKKYKTRLSQTWLRGAFEKEWKENLDDLEKIVVPVYGKIENKKLSKSVYSEHPWGPEELNREVRFVPKNDSHMLKIRFPTPDRWEFYKYAPLDFVRHLLHHEGPGSLILKLRETNWIHNLYAGSSAVPGFGYFSIYIQLTEKGINHVNEIVKLIFQYFHLLKTNGIPENIFDEVKKLCELDFRFADKEDPLDHVYDISTSLQLGISFEDVLSYGTPSQWNPSIIKGFLDFFGPENMNILIGSKLFENEVDLVDQWYGTRYKVRRISEALISEIWKITQHYHGFHLPPPNEFIPSNFDVYPSETNRSEFPRIIHESNISQFWFKQDDKFEIPKFIIQINIFNPMMSTTPQRSLLSTIFSNLFGIMFKTRVDGYTLSLAGLSWQVTKLTRGLNVCEIEPSCLFITLSGYTEKLLQFSKTFLAELVNFKILEEKFDICKENLMQVYENFDTNQPCDQVNTYISSLLMFENTFSVQEARAILKTINVDDMRKYKKQFFTRVFIQGLIYGNCDEKLAQEVVSTMESAFPLKSVVLAQEIQSLRVVVIDDGMNYIFEAQHEHSADSAYLGHFQLEPCHPTRNIVVTSLFAQIVSEKCFKTLRTDEQLGYVVGCKCTESNGIMSFSVWVQSARNPVYVNSRVEAFLKQLKQILIEMSPEEYETNKSSMRNKYTKKIFGPIEMVNDIWNEIGSRRYLFEWKEESITQLDMLQKEDIIEFFETYIAESDKRRKIDIHITSKITNPPVPEDEPIKKSVKILDSATFAHGLAAYPMLVSRREVAPLGAPVPL